MADAKYFKRGKVEELRAELNSDKKDPKFTKKRSVLKRIVANMTMGNDMASLFPDVLACMQLPSLEIKKMVYLYIINYAKSAPELVIMAVNSFIKDSSDPNPLIRALAIRTMGYINVDKITSCLVEPLRHCFKDSDPYVRKTAAITVCKMYTNSPSLTETEGYIGNLESLLADPNPTVVANAAAALIEIYDRDLSRNHSIGLEVANKILSAINETNEWGATYIIEALMYFVPRDSHEAETIAERITSRLQHANSGVVLSSVKLIVYMMNFITNPEEINSLCRKLAPPLITLLHTAPEIQYVALRNILLIMQKYPSILRDEIKVFYCKYNDPIYVKLAKLEVMMRLANENNVEQILSELKEYASEVDVDFVRKSVRSIGLCAVKIEKSAEKCVAVLVDLIQTKVNYVVQEAIVVIKDIFRKYPNRYESIIGILCENLDHLDEPGAKASMVWIIGQYGDRIENARELLETFLDAFSDEPEEVQLALLTATVKLFIKRPTVSQDLVPKVLKWCTDADNPDLRDRGFMYWRLLSADPAAAKSILFADRPPISADTESYDPVLLQELLTHAASLASIYHRPPHLFLEGFRRRPFPGASLAPAASATTTAAAPKGPANEYAATTYNPYALSDQPAAKPSGQVMNLLDLDEPEPQKLDLTGIVNPFGGAVASATGTTLVLAAAGSPVVPNGATTALANDLGGLSIVSPGGIASLNTALVYGSGVESISAAAYQQPKQCFLTPQQAKGLDVWGSFARRGGRVFLDLTMTNKALEPLQDFAVQFNKNMFGLKVAGPMQIRLLPPGQGFETQVALGVDGPVGPMNPVNVLQVALKDNVGVFYFQTLLPLHVFFLEEPLERDAFISLWREVPVLEAGTGVFSLSGVRALDAGNASGQAAVVSLRTKLSANNVFVVADRELEGRMVVFASVKLHNNVTFLLEFTIIGPGALQVQVKTFTKLLVESLKEALTNILTKD